MAGRAAAAPAKPVGRGHRVASPTRSPPRSRLASNPPLLSDRPIDTAPPIPARRPHRLLRLSLRIGLLVVALVLALFAVEWTLTTFDLFGVNYPAETMRYRTELAVPTWTRPDGTHDLDGTLFVQRPGAEVEFGSFTVRTNAQGFRGPDIEPKPAADVYRILVLGDSVAFGWGVDDEVTFLRRFEGELNARADGRRYEVVNAGVLLYDTTQQAALLERRGLALEPDLVLLVFVVNDVEPSRDLAEMALGLRDLPPVSEEPGLVAGAGRLFRSWLPSTAAVADLVLGPGEDWDAIVAAHGDGPYVPEEVGDGPRGWERARVALRGMRDLCAARSVPFVVLDHSYPPVRALPVFCIDEGIAIEPLRFTIEELEEPIYNSAMDPHANARGHELLLDKLRSALDRRGLPSR